MNSYDRLEYIEQLQVWETKIGMLKQWLEDGEQVTHEDKLLMRELGLDI